MRKLIALFVLLLSATAASAQADKAQPVTKLPGEEKLSLRERAERDFLMPVRRKKAEKLAAATTISAEQLATAAPETDATAHYTEAAPSAPVRAVRTSNARAEEAVVLTRREVRLARLRVVRRAHLRNLERLAEIRAERRTEAHRAARHHSSRKVAKASKASKASKVIKASKHSVTAKHSRASKHSAAAKHSSKKAAHKAKIKVKTKVKKATAKHKHRR